MILMILLLVALVSCDSQDGNGSEAAVTQEKAVVTQEQATYTKVEPAPQNYVADRADVIDADTELELIDLLNELERKTSARVIVLTVSSTEGQPIDQYALERGNTWKFGKNQKSASVLLL